MALKPFKQKLHEFPDSWLTMCLLVSMGLLSIYTDLIPLLRGFNFDVPRMITKMAKHPMAWIDWARVTGLSVAAFIVWIRYRDNEWPTTPEWWLIFGTTLVIGIPSGMMLFLYLRQRQKERYADESRA